MTDRHHHYLLSIHIEEAALLLEWDQVECGHLSVELILVCSSRSDPVSPPMMHCELTANTKKSIESVLIAEGSANYD